MAYEPGGKTKIGVDAILGAPNRIWLAADLAPLMDVARSAVPAYLDRPIRHGLIFRSVETGAPRYAGTAFAPAPSRNAIHVPTFGKDAAAAAADSVGAESKHARQPGPSGFVPPKMTAPRVGSDIPAPSRAPGPPPTGQKLCAGCTRDICREKGCWSQRANQLIEPRAPAAASPAPAPTVAPTPAPTAAPTPAPTPPAVTPAPTEAPQTITVVNNTPGVIKVEERWVDGELVLLVRTPETPAAPAEQAAAEAGAAEPEPFDVLFSIMTGEVVFQGIEPNEDGSFSLSAERQELVRDKFNAMRSRLAWMGPT
jgi:hypothetical protein